MLNNNPCSWFFTVTIVSTSVLRVLITRLSSSLSGEHRCASGSISFSENSAIVSLTVPSSLLGQ
ncbi:MAG: hypothetical protein H5T33_08075 [Candidatus Methanosuratus sp.]|nr:hypothetical protein [Candidatus Methanosuratincola sp.]